jgi:hypothetical protein
MFQEEQVSSSALFTFCFGGMPVQLAFPPADIILALLACPLNDTIICFQSGITNLSLYNHL